MVIQSWHFIVLYFLLHGLHFVITLRVLKLVLSFHMTLFHYSAKGVRDIDHTCTCHQSNIMPDDIFSVDITVYNLWLLFFCMHVCVFRGDILGSFYSYRKGAQVFHYYINGLEEP